jgi:DDE superfamily endonuclease
MSSRRRHRIYIMAYLMYVHNNDDDQSFRAMLTDVDRCIRDRRIPRIALLDPQASPWEHLYSSKNNQALITLTGFDHKSFAELVTLFEPYFMNYTPWNFNGVTKLKRVDPLKRLGGRPRKVNAKSCLALCLTYYRFRGSFFILQGWFGFTGTPLGVWTNFARILLIHVLHNDVSKVQWPDNDKINVYKKIIERKYPILKNVFCVCDGLKLNLQQAGDGRVQNRFYNGWTHGHYITNLFVFAPDGLIISCLVNAPGSVHDSTLADWGNVYESLSKIYDENGGRCVMDSAFAALQHPCILRSSKNETLANSALEIMEGRAATSLRQSAEWGMRAIQSAFPRLLDSIKYEDKGERKLILICMVMLYNFRWDRVGLNQIRSVYVPEWNKSIDDLLF